MTTSSPGRVAASGRAYGGWHLMRLQVFDIITSLMFYIKAESELTASHKYFVFSQYSCVCLLHLRIRKVRHNLKTEKKILEKEPLDHLCRPQYSCKKNNCNISCQPQISPSDFFAVKVTSKAEIYDILAIFLRRIQRLEIFKIPADIM